MSKKPSIEDVIAQIDMMTALERNCVRRHLGRKSEKLEAPETAPDQDGVPPPLGEWMTTEEAADFLDMNRSQICKYSKKPHRNYGKLIARGGHRDRRIRTDSVVLFFAKQSYRFAKKEFPDTGIAEAFERVIAACSRLVEDHATNR